MTGLMYNAKRVGFSVRRPDFSAFWDPVGFPENTGRRNVIPKRNLISRKKEEKK